jgi:hypothetical protein
MSRVKFVLTAVIGVVVAVSSSNTFAQDCCCDNGGWGRSQRVGLIARIRANRANRSAYANCCPTQTDCCQPQTACCQAPAPCCATPAPCCQTACCETSCHSCCATNCCRQGGGLVRNFRARGCSNCGYTSQMSGCCGTTTGCSGCAGCAGGQIIQGASEGVIVPEASGQPVAPDAPTPTPETKSDT